jgi:hypothetical protein
LLRRFFHAIQVVPAALTVSNGCEITILEVNEKLG